MEKKAQSLSLNTIIIAILVVLVLIVVVTFFLGGFSNIKNTIVNVFYPITSGTDLTIAVQTCEQRCDQARLLPFSVVSKSSYCTNYFNIDLNGDGEADKEADELKKFYCHGPELNTPCEIKDDLGKPLQLKKYPDCTNQPQ